MNEKIARFARLHASANAFRFSSARQSASNLFGFFDEFGDEGTEGRREDDDDDSFAHLLSAVPPNRYSSHPVIPRVRAGWVPPLEEQIY